MTAVGNTGIEYFDRMYEVPDPWGYETSWYEQRKYALTLASLPRLRYARIFEPGCSIGVLSEQLAVRGDHLLAADFHGPTLERARRRLRGRPGTAVAALEIPAVWPPGTFDLIVLSEVAYYLDDVHLAILVERVVTSLEPGGDLVLVHWRGETDYPQTGDGVHDRWCTDRRFSSVASYRDDDLRLDVLRLRDASGSNATPATTTTPTPSR